MTKIYINFFTIKNNVSQYLNNSTTDLSSIYNYFNDMIIPDDYVNKKYLEWFRDEINNIQNSINDIRLSIDDVVTSLNKRQEQMLEYFDLLEEISINDRKNNVR